jgi:two-component system LytT family sensor kinase
MNQRTYYWVCQVGGWSTYGIIMGVFYMLADPLKFTSREIISILFTCVFALAITHIFRYALKYWNWVKLPLVQLIPQVLAANIGMAAVFIALTFITERLIGIEQQTAFDWKLIFVAILNASLLFLLWSLMYFAMFFFRNYKKEEIERLKWESAIKDFELNKLKSQLNPHFVFNALNSIRSLVDEDPHKAKSAITQMSNILRNSLLADRAKTIPLGEELRTVNDYLNLEKLRYEERLGVQMSIEDNTLGIQVPPMMIQTLVENAVKHGISKQVSNGFIEVKSYLEKGLLKVSIRNSGQLGSATSSSTGFGILNTLQRLELLYGAGQATFDIVQEGENVVAATLVIPTNLPARSIAFTS